MHDGVPVVGGLILAAGEGRRFGGPKQLAPLRGRPVLEHAVRAMVAVPAIDPLFVVLGARAAEVRAGVDFHGAESTVCADWDEGVAASLRHGVAALGEVDAVVVTLGDQPFITPQVIAGALDWDDDWHDAVRTTYRGRPSHPVLLTRRLLERLPRLRGDVGFRDVLLGARVRRFEAGHLADPTDIDTREQLETLT